MTSKKSLATCGDSGKVSRILYVGANTRPVPTVISEPSGVFLDAASAPVDDGDTDDVQLAMLHLSDHKINLAYTGGPFNPDNFGQTLRPGNCYSGRKPSGAPCKRCDDKCATQATSGGLMSAADGGCGKGENRYKVCGNNLGPHGFGPEGNGDKGNMT